MSDLTVVYYTSNREKEPFEDKICAALMEAKGGSSLISVSQKPMQFGKNICVGDVGVSSQNAYRQLMIGAEEATTEFVCTAESDFLYDPAYFEFRPKNMQTFYLARPCWVLVNIRRKQRKFFKKHDGADAPLVASRELLIARLRYILKGLEYWGSVHPDATVWPYLLDQSEVNVEMFNAGRGSVTFKTNENMHRRSRWIRGSATRNIAGWADAGELISEYCG